MKKAAHVYFFIFIQPVIDRLHLLFIRRSTTKCSGRVLWFSHDEKLYIMMHAHFIQQFIDLQMREM